MLGDPTPAERSVLGAIAYQPQHARRCTPTRGCCRRNRAPVRAGTTGSIPDAPARDRHLLDELAPGDPSRRRPLLVTLNRTDAIDPATVLAEFEYEHPVFDAAAMRAQRRRRRDPGRAGHLLRRRLLGLRVPRGRRAERARGRPTRSGPNDEPPVAIYEGTARHSARRSPSRREFAPRLFLAYLDVDALPGSLDRAAGLVGPPARAGALPAPRLLRRRRAPARRRGTRPRRATARSPARRAASICSRSCAPSAGCSIPLAVYYCWAADGARPRRRRARGDEHAVARTPLVRVRRAGRSTAAHGPRRRQCTCRPSSRWTSTTASRGPRPVRTCTSRSKSCEKGLSCSRPRSRCTESFSTSREAVTVLVRYPFATLRVSLAIYRRALALLLARVPLYLHPSRRVEEVRT